ncbi:MAG TPA: PEP-CTERM sorting domain-containing protein [Candidatus Polarisedimenticolia bacterium]|nr:PEP-CTERM sorting domain-containing protein [Candidatus Polarisedimenticolia bacterium]
MKRKTTLLGLAFLMGMGLEKNLANTPTFLLTINVSNPSAVTIAATGANSIADDTGRTAGDGVDLLDFFSQNEPISGPVSGSSLQGGGSTLSYNQAVGDNDSTLSGSRERLDLNIFYQGGFDPETFSTTAPAFTGSLTLDLSSMGVNVSALPAAGSQGDIIAGWSGNRGSVIGQWQVAPVPEPGTGTLVLLGSVAGFIVRRNRARKKHPGTRLSH